jgi:hypothetical protein
MLHPPTTSVIDSITDVNVLRQHAWDNRRTGYDMSFENHRCEDADFSDYLAPPHFFVRKKKIAKKKTGTRCGFQPFHFNVFGSA